MTSECENSVLLSLGVEAVEERGQVAEGLFERHPAISSAWHVPDRAHAEEGQGSPAEEGNPRKEIRARKCAEPKSRNGRGALTSEEPEIAATAV